MWKKIRNTVLRKIYEIEEKLNPDSNFDDYDLGYDDLDYDDDPDYDDELDYDDEPAPKKKQKVLPLNRKGKIARLTRWIFSTIKWIVFIALAILFFSFFSLSGTLSALGALLGGILTAPTFLVVIIFIILVILGLASYIYFG